AADAALGNNSAIRKFLACRWNKTGCASLLATRDPRRNARPKSKAFVHLLAVSGNLDNAGALSLPPKAKIDRARRSAAALQGDRIAKSPVGPNAKSRRTLQLSAYRANRKQLDDLPNGAFDCKRILRTQWTPPIPSHRVTPVQSDRGALMAEARVEAG